MAPLANNKGLEAFSGIKMGLVMSGIASAVIACFGVMFIALICGCCGGSNKKNKKGSPGSEKKSHVDERTKEHGVGKSSSARKSSQIAKSTIEHRIEKSKRSEKKGSSHAVEAGAEGSQHLKSAKHNVMKSGRTGSGDGESGDKKGTEFKKDHESTKDTSKVKAQEEIEYAADDDPRYRSMVELECSGHGK